MGNPKRTNPNELTPQQERAVLLLAEGLRPSEVVHELSIGRTTLWEWRQLDLFEARFNEAQQEAQEALRARVRSLQLKALRVMEEALDGDDELRHRLTAARLVTKLCPLPEPAPLGPTDPAKIAARKAEAEARRLEQARLARMNPEERRALLRQKHEEEMADCWANLGL